MGRPNNNAPRARLGRWHRRAGITGALFFVLLTGSGLILNHTDALGLDARLVQSAWLLDLYRIAAPPNPVAYDLGGHIVTQLGERLYLDTQELPDRAGQVVGALRLGERLIVAVPDKLLVFNRAAALIERLDGTDGVPAGMRAIGVTASGALIVRAAHGDYTADLDRLDWRQVPAETATWATPAPVPAKLRKALEERYRGTGLSLERVILDLHSGRILGEWGVYVVDAAAILFLVLVATGLWMWARQRG